MIGHPVIRAWYERHQVPAGRPSIDDPHVQGLVDRIAPGAVPTDLGGSDSLNLRLGDSDVVLRVNKPFVSRRQIVAGQVLRRRLAAAGAAVAAPIIGPGGPVMQCGPFQAHLERYVPGLRPMIGAALFDSIGRFHHAASTIKQAPPRALVSTSVSTRTLQRWLGRNVAAGHPAFKQPGTAEELSALITMLARDRVPPDTLPGQLIHHDAHPDNIRQNAAGIPFYLDLGGVADGPRIHDVAYALAHALFAHQDCTDPPDLATYAWNQVPDLLTAYERGARSALTAQEQAALLGYAAAVSILYDVCVWGHRRVGHIGRWLLEHPSAIPG
ncbi:MAG: phosphotransferase [Nakamurella sp.]